MSTRTTTFIAFIFSMAALLTQLALYVKASPINEWDLMATRALQYDHSAGRDEWMSIISLRGNEFSLSALIIAVAVIYYIAAYKLEAFFVALIPLTDAAQFAIKEMVGRPRPSDFYVRVLEFNTTSCFPSGTVTTYMVFFGFQIILMFRLDGIPIILKNSVWLISFLMLSVIAYSRIYLGAHWLTDTIAGYILGLIVLTIVCWVYLKIQANMPFRATK
jgi:membrane-associated phospholipid phosphatase